MSRTIRSYMYQNAMAKMDFYKTGVFYITAAHGGVRSPVLTREREADMITTT